MGVRLRNVILPSGGIKLLAGQPTDSEEPAVAPDWTTPAGLLGEVSEQEAANFPLIATPGGVTFTVHAGELPPGLEIDSATGLISGTAEAVTDDTNYVFTIRATLGAETVDRIFNITILADYSASWITEAGNLAQLRENEVANIQLEADGPPGETLNFTLVLPSALPANLSLSPAGLISGTVAPVDLDVIVPFTVRVTDLAGNSEDRLFNLAILDVSQRVYSAAGTVEVVSGGLRSSIVGGPTGQIHAVAADPNGNYAVAMGNVISAYTFKGQKLWTYSGHTNTVTALAMDAAGNVYTGSVDRSNAKINADGSLAWAFPYHTAGVVCLALGPDGVYSGGRDARVRKLDLTTGAQLWNISPQSGQIFTVGVSPDGQTVYATQSSTIRAFAAATGAQQWSVAPSTNTISAMGVTPTGDLLVGHYDGRVRRLSATGVPIWTVQPHTGTLEAITTDTFGNIYSTAADRTVQRLDATTGASQWSRTTVGNINDIAVDATAGLIVGTTIDLRCYRPNGDIQWESASSGTARDVALDDDLNVYVVSTDRTLRKYTREGYQVWSRTDHTSTIVGVAVDTAGNIYSSSMDRTLKKYNSAGVLQWTYVGVNTIHDVVVDESFNAYIASDDKTLRKILPNGTQSWAYTGTYQYKAVALDDDDNVYGSGLGGTITKLSNDGTHIWTKTIGTANRDGIAVDEDGNIYVGGTAEILKLDPAGNQVDSETLGGIMSVSDVKYDLESESIFVASLDNKVRCLNKDLQVQWTYTGTSTVYGITPTSLILRAPRWITSGGQIADVNEYAVLDQLIEAEDPLGGDIAYSVGVGSLPPGITLNPATGALTGITGGTSSGTYATFVFEAVATSETTTNSQLFSIRVRNNQEPVWTTATGKILEILENTALSDTAVVATDPDPGQALTFTVQSGTLPEGVTMNAAGEFSGTTEAVAADLTSTFVVRATDPGGKYKDREFSILVLKNQPPLWLTPGGLVRTTVEEVADSFALVAKDPETGVPASNVTFSLITGTLPDGLTLDTTTGVVSGTPAAVTADTDSTFIVRVADDVGNEADRQFSIRVLNNTAPTWTTPVGIIGTAVENDTVSLNVLATDVALPASSGTVGGVVTYAVQDGTLPVGLTLNGTTGVLSGTLATAETANFTIRASDAQGRYTDRAFSYVVLDNQPPDWVTPAGLLGEVTETRPFTATLEATDPENLAVTYAVAPGSTLPGTMAITGAVLSGNAPAATGDTAHTFSVRASDPAGNYTDREFSIMVLENVPIEWVTPSGTLGEFAEYAGITGSTITVQATHPQGLAITYALAPGSATLPPGLAVNANGTITGSIGSVATDTTYPFSVRATDAAGGTADREFSISVTDVPLFVHAVAADDIQGFSSSGTRDSNTTVMNDTAAIAIAVDPDDNLFLNLGSKVRCVNADGSHKWTYYSWDLPLRACMYYYDGAVYVGRSLSIIKLDAADGSLLQTISLGIDALDIAVDATGIAVGNLSAVRKYSHAGSQIWTVAANGSSVELDASGNVIHGSGTTTNAAITRRNAASPGAILSSATGTPTTFSFMRKGGDGNIYAWNGKTLYRFATTLGAPSASYALSATGASLVASAGGAAHHYAMTIDRVLHKIAYADFSQTWSYTLPTYTTGGSGTTGNHIAEAPTSRDVYAETWNTASVGTRECIVRVAAAGNAIQWRIDKVPGVVNAGKLYEDGSCVLWSSARYMSRFSPLGTLLWEFDRTSGGDVNVHTDTDGFLYTERAGVLRKTNPATGATVFEVLTNTGVTNYTFTKIGPQNQLYMAANTGVLYRNSTVDGSAIWNVSHSGNNPGALAVDSTGVYMASNASTGTPLKKYNHSGGFLWQVGVQSSSAKAIAVDEENDAIYVNHINRSVSRYRASDGAHQWNTAVGITSSSSSFDEIAVGPNGIYVSMSAAATAATNNTMIYRLTADGSVQESFDAKERIYDLAIRPY